MAEIHYQLLQVFDESVRRLVVSVGVDEDLNVIRPRFTPYSVVPALRAGAVRNDARVKIKAVIERLVLGQPDFDVLCNHFTHSQRLISYK